MTSARTARTSARSSAGYNENAPFGDPADLARRSRGFASPPHDGFAFSIWASRHAPLTRSSAGCALRLNGVELLELPGQPLPAEVLRVRTRAGAHPRRPHRVPKQGGERVAEGARIVVDESVLSRPEADAADAERRADD